MSALRNALLDTPEKVFAYQHNAEFHALIETLLLTLPGLVESYARLGIAKDVDLKSQVDDAMRSVPQPVREPPR